MPEPAVVVGSGPNGLAAAIVPARAGHGVRVLEGSETLGGGCRSAELTLPGFVHDTCSSVHSLALASPFLSALPLADHGLELVHPAAPFAHPMDDGTAVMLERSVLETAAGLGPDGRAYRQLLEPLVEAAGPLFSSAERSQFKSCLPGSAVNSQLGRRNQNSEHVRSRKPRDLRALATAAPAPTPGRCRVVLDKPRV